MHGTGSNRQRASVQLAVMRTPTTSLVEAVAEARRRHDEADLRQLGATDLHVAAAAA